MTTLSLDPNNADAWFSKGFALLQLGKYQEALDALNKALEINPNLPNKAEIWSQTGLALANPGRYLEAVDAFDTSLSINPNSEVKSNKETVEVYTRNISATSTPTTMANDINQGLINEINR